MNGKLHGWEAVVLLPFIDEGLLLRAMSDALRGTWSAKAEAEPGAGAGAGAEAEARAGAAAADGATAGAGAGEGAGGQGQGQGAGMGMTNGGEGHARDGLDALLPEETRRRNTLGRPQLYSAAPARFGCGEAGGGGGQCVAFVQPEQRRPHACRPLP